MIQKNFKRPYVGIWIRAILIIITGVVLSFLSSCRTTKSFEASIDKSSVVEQHYRDSIRTVDSIRLSKYYEEKIKEMTTDISFYRNNEEELVDALNELTDSLNAKGQLTTDMQARIKRVLDSVQTVCSSRSTAKINPDGSIELSGQLKSLNLKLLQMQKKSEQDSIALHQKQAGTEIDNKETVEEKTDISQTKKTGWPWWVWLLIGGAIAHSYRLIPAVKKILT